MKIYANKLSIYTEYDADVNAYRVTTALTSWFEIHGTSNTVYNWQIKQSRDAIDSLTFDVYPDNPLYSVTANLNVLIKTTGDDEKKFFGRIAGIEPQMDSSGITYKSITCESCKAFLLDTAVEIDGDAYFNDDDGYLVYPLDADTNTLYDDNTFGVKAADLVKTAVACHNRKVNAVDDYKRIYCDMSGTWQNVIEYVSDTYDTTTWEYITSVVETAGGEIKVEYSESGTHAQFVHLTIADRLETTSSGEIAIADNMISCVQSITPSDLISVLTIRGDSYTTDETNSEGVEYTANHRISLLELKSAVGSNFDTWVDDVIASFNNRYWRGSTKHNFVRVSSNDNAIGELNAIKAYSGINGNLAINGVFDTSGWNDDDTYTSITGWLAANATEDKVKRLINIALRYFDNHDKITPSITINAADVALIDSSYNKFALYQWWDVKNSLINLDDSYEIVEISWKQGSEHLPDITLGRKPTRSVDTGIHIRKKVDVKNGTNSSTNGTDTSSVSDSFTDSSYSNSDISNPYSSSTGSDGWTHKVVTSLPTSPDEKTIYFIKDGS